jgi:FAD:protein FMN transferase
VLAALVAAALATCARADETYLSDADAPAAVFPAATRFERLELKSTPQLRARVADRLADVKPTIWEPSYRIAVAFADDRRIGRAIEVAEIGKHRPITLMVGVDDRGAVAGVAVMTYREAYGGEIRSRRFLQQYRGKSARDPLAPSQDIQNITGATLSARAVGRAVKKAIAVLQEAGTGSIVRARDPRVETVATPCTPSRVREAHYVMGTILDITVDAPCAATGRRWIHTAVAEARRLDAELSSFRADSALSQLNRAAGRGFRAVPDDLYRLLCVSRALSADTAGRFDVTVSPLVQLWERAGAANRWPATVDIAAARAAVGTRQLQLRQPNRVALGAHAALELGGIGKGYAADRIADLLRRLGVTSALVNFGESSIVAIGPPPGRAPWRLWVRDGERLDGPLALRDMALSTSASLGQTRRVAGRRIGHIIDPATGRPLVRRAQATIVARSATEAEAWSKALLIDPPAAFRALAGGERRGGLLLEPGRAKADRRFAEMCDWRSAAR